MGFPVCIHDRLNGVVFPVEVRHEDFNHDFRVPRPNRFYGLRKVLRAAIGHELDAASARQRHFGHRDQKTTIGEADPELVELGQKLYRSGNAESGVAPCMGCHGPNGAGNPAAGYPALRGQHALYVENQLHGFASGVRHNENAIKMMQILASRMTNREIKAVSSYIQGLH